MHESPPNVESLAYSVGEWHVLPSLGVLRRGEHEVRLTLQQMRLLELLIDRGNDVVSKDDLLEGIWQGTAVEDNAVARCVSEVRRLLGDDARRPCHIQTLPKRGYRLIAPVAVLAPEKTASSLPNQHPLSNTPDDGRGRAEMGESDPVDTSAARRRATRGRRRLQLASAVTAAAVLILLGARFWTVPEPIQSGPTTTGGLRTLELRGAQRHRPTIAVIPLVAHDPEPDTAWLSAALAEMLTTELAASDDLAVVPRAVVTGLRHELSLSLVSERTDDTLARVQQTLGVDFLVGGTFLVTDGDDGQIRVDLRIRRQSGSDPVQALAVDGTREHLPGVVATAGRGLLARIGARQPEVPRPAMQRPERATEITALRRYVEALGALRRQDGRTAVALLEDSLAASPDRPLSYLALSDAWSLLGYRTRAEDTARRAEALVPRLAREQRLWVEAHLKEIQSAWQDAIDLYRLLWSERPENLEFGLRLARTQIAGGDAEDAIDTLRALAEANSEPPHDPRLGLAEAAAHFQLGRLDPALEAAERAETLAFTVGAGLVVGKARHLSASILYELGRTRHAKERLERAHNAFARSKDHRRLAEVQSTLSGWIASEGDFEGARGLAEAALETFRQIGDRNGEAGLLVTLAALEQESGAGAEADNMLLDAIEIYREIDRKEGEASALSQRGTSAARESRFDEAHADFSRAVVLYRELGNRAREGAMLINLARTHMLRAQWHDASALLSEAEPMIAETGSDRSHALLLVNVGLAHAATGDLLLAEVPLRRAAELFRHIGNSPELANALSLLGEVLVDRGDLAAARSALEEALSLRRDIGEPARIANSRIALTVALIESGEFERAEFLAGDTVDLAGAKVNQVIAALRLLARVRLKQGQLEEASLTIGRAAGLLETSPVVAPDALSRSWVPITRARIEAARGDHRAAMARLEALLETPTIGALRLIDAEARLALAEIEIAIGATERAKSRLEELIEDAETAGWSLLAGKVNHSLSSIPPA